MLISLSRVATPSSPNSRSRLGIGARVVNDEAGVEGQQPAAIGGDVVGVRVAAQPVVRLVERDVIGALQQVRGGQAGHAAPTTAARGRSAPVPCGTAASSRVLLENNTKIH